MLDLGKLKPDKNLREAYERLHQALLSGQDNGERNIKIRFRDAKSFYDYFKGLFAITDAFNEAPKQYYKLNYEEKQIIDAKPDKKV